MTKDYDAFGNVETLTGSTTNRFSYASSWGYQTDPGSGLQLLGNRYYDPTIGRFLTKDPIRDGRNWYAYCRSSPLRFVDPLGLKPGDKFKTADEAAIDFVSYVLGKYPDKIGGTEYIAEIVQNADGSFTYVEPRAGSEASNTTLVPVKWVDGNLSNGELAGIAHTHPNRDGHASGNSYNSEEFSRADCHTANFHGVPVYLECPNGDIKKVDPAKKTDSKQKDARGKPLPIGVGKKTTIVKAPSRRSKWY
jgi:RHS repeat-associated protein